MRAQIPFFGLSLVVAALAALGCARGDRFDGSGANLRLATSSPTTQVGETTTVSAMTADTAGRQPLVEWDAPGASRVERLENGRAVRLRYDNPGQYTVRASTIVGDGDVVTDGLVITVRPVP